MALFQCYGPWHLIYSASTARIIYLCIVSKSIHAQYIIRFSDCDPAGHLNNAKYIEYFLNAREDHVKQHYNLAMSEFYEGDHAWVVASHRIQYAIPVEHGTEVLIHSAIVSCRKQGMVVEFWMTDLKGEKIYALMQTDFAYVDLQNLQKVDHEVSLLEKLKGTIDEIDMDMSLQRRMLVRLRELRSAT